VRAKTARGEQVRMPFARARRPLGGASRGSGSLRVVWGRQRGVKRILGVFRFWGPQLGARGARCVVDVDGVRGGATETMGLLAFQRVEVAKTTRNHLSLQGK
jgi:hypothetical protein